MSFILDFDTDKIKLKDVNKSNLNNFEKKNEIIKKNHLIIMYTLKKGRR